MNDTVFYVLGIGLVVAAVAVSFVGLRIQRFPASRALLAGVTAAFALLVVATATFAWRNAEDEQTSREAEEAASQEGEAQTPVDSATTTTTAAADGAEVFATAGCTGCHRLADAGSTATVGPDLDGALRGKPIDFIRTSIVDPSAEVETGFPPNTMPETYGTQLSPEELDALVGYLADVTGAKG